MKNLFFALAGTFLALSLTAMGIGDNGGFTTRIEIAGFPDSTFLLARIHDGAAYADYRFDTVYVVDGKAVVRDVSRMKAPARMYIYTDSGVITTYVQNGHSELLSGSVSDIEKEALRYEGAPWSRDMMIYNKEVGALYKYYVKKVDNFSSMTAEEQVALIGLFARYDSLDKAYLMEYPNAWHSLSKMTNAMMDLPRQDVQKIYDALEAEQRESEYGQVIHKFLSIKTIEEGDSLALFNIIAKDQNDSLVNLIEIKEPYILLDFSQCYCGPCISAAKEIHDIADKYAGKVAFVNYSCDDSERDWRKAVKRDKITWSSLYNGEGSEGTTCMKYKVNSYPTFFLFGPDRTLLLRMGGYGTGMLDAHLKGLLSE